MRSTSSCSSSTARRERVSLGTKQLTEDPWSHVPEKYPAGSRVTGRVTNVTDYGAFVELEEGVEGLVHVSEMSWSKKVKNPSKVVSPGDTVEAVVSDVNRDARRISLSLKDTLPDPWDSVLEKYSVGSRVSGKVRNLTDFGAFVELEEGIDGLVHVSDMSWTKRVKHPSEVLKKGDDVEAIITSIDQENRRISLSIKEFQPNDWQTFRSKHQPGDVVEGVVSRVADFGVFVQIDGLVEGLMHVSETPVPRGGKPHRPLPRGRHDQGANPPHRRRRDEGRLVRPESRGRPRGRDSGGSARHRGGGSGRGGLRCRGACRGGGRGGSGQEEAHPQEGGRSFHGSVREYRDGPERTGFQRGPI